MAVMSEPAAPAGPDLTAVGAAFGRAAHVLLDPAPHVFTDTLSLKLADEPALRAANLLAPDGGLALDPREPRAQWRGTFAARARFVEELVAERLELGVTQYVILGAGLDTFAQRRPELASRLRVFEIDGPVTQAWKRERLRALALAVPEGLRFVPVDFESGDSWVREIARHGFDLTRPAVIASTGVAQCISREACAKTLREAAELAAGTTFVSTFMLPIERIDPRERELRALTEQRAAARGFPWISFYSAEEFVSLARGAGFDDLRHVSSAELNQRYFAGRSDGLRAADGEHLITATRRERR